MSILNNPGCPNPFNEENIENYQKHRYFVLSRLKKIETLDSRPVTKEEKKITSGPEDFLPVIPSGSRILSPLNKTIIGFLIAKQGEMTIVDIDEEYIEWNPSYIKIGEGKLMIFKDKQNNKPEVTINLIDSQVEIVEDEIILKKLATNLELIKIVFKNQRTMYLALNDKEIIQEWISIFTSESQDQTESDWDEIERRSTQMKLMQEDLKKKTSKNRLRRALDSAYTIESNEIKLIHAIGHGGFGVVYQGLIRNKTVAVKLFHNQDLSVEALNDFCNEVEILSKFHHPQIILFMGACIDPLMIVTELMTGDLEKLLLDPNVSLSLLTRLRFAKDASMGIAWLHASNPMILHRDIKTSNFLVDENMRVVVCDFGLSETLRQGSSTWDDSGYKGTIYFTSPEVLKNANFNQKADVYSFGLVLWQILTRQLLYPEFKDIPSGQIQKEIFDKVVFNQYRPQIPNECPENFKSLIQDCWDSNPENRPNFDTIVQRIQELIYEEAIPNIEARNIWKEWFPGGLEQIKFSKFWEHFSFLLISNFENLKISHEDEIFIRELLTPYQENIINPIHSGFVTCEAFGDFIQCFGPIIKNHNLITYSRNIVSQKWFFGYITIQSTFNYLYDKPEGTFLVRFSKSNRGDFSISYVSKDLRIIHQHIDKKVKIDENNKPIIQYQINSTGQSWDDLGVLIKELDYLKIPCSGYPYASFFENRFLRSNVNDIFLDSHS